MFVKSSNLSCISQILKVADPLGEKFEFRYFGMYNLKQLIAKRQKSDS